MPTVQTSVQLHEYAEIHGRALRFRRVCGIKKESLRMSESLRDYGSTEISRFRAIVVAVLRAKQLSRGSKPRIAPYGERRKNTSIAMEEVRQGLITYTYRGGPHPQDARVMGGVEPPLKESNHAVELEHDSF